MCDVPGKLGYLNRGTARCVDSESPRHCDKAMHHMPPSQPRHAGRQARAKHTRTQYGMYIHTHRSRPTRGRIMAEKPWTDASSASANSSLRWTMFEWVCVCACVRVCVCVCGKQWVKWSAGGLHSLGDVCKEPFFDCCCCCWLQFEEVRTRTQQKGAPKAKTARPISAQTRVDHPWINRIDRQGCWLGDWGVSNPQHDKWGRLDFEGRWGARQP